MTPFKNLLPEILNNIKKIRQKYYQPKNEFGLNSVDTYKLVSLAKTSEAGYDAAEELAVSGYGLNFTQFSSLMKNYPLKDYSFEQIDSMFNMKKLNESLQQNLPSNSIEKKKLKI